MKNLMMDLSPADLRQINSLTLSFRITGTQAVALYWLAGKSWPQAHAALIRAEMAGEEVYAGALRCLRESGKETTPDPQRVTGYGGPEEGRRR